MKTGYKIVAIIERVDGKEPLIRISDPNFKVIKAKDGDICIVHSNTEKYYPIINNTEKKIHFTS